MIKHNIITVNGIKYAPIIEDAKEEKEKIVGKYCAAYNITKPNGEKIIRAQFTRPISMALKGKSTHIIGYCSNWKEAEKLINDVDATLSSY